MDMLTNFEYFTNRILTASLEQNHLLPSRLLSPHARYYVREMRILGYQQILESYRSLTLTSLASSFGVSVEFVDRWVAPSFLLPIQFPFSALLPLSAP